MDWTALMEGLLAVPIILLVLLFLFMPLFCAIWAMRDADARGKSGCLVAILVFFFWPLGLILWLIFRPNEQR